jgi:hypothetical protein
VPVGVLFDYFRAPDASTRAALQWLSERTHVVPSKWALGIQARVRALLSEGDVAERLYPESVARLGRTRLGAEVARTHLLYCEWLRRERRRADAREQLRTAHQMLATRTVPWWIRALPPDMTSRWTPTSGGAAGAESEGGAMGRVWTPG